MYNIIPRAITKKAKQINTFKNTIDTLKWHSKKCSKNAEKDRKTKTDKPKTRQQT